MAVSVAFPSLEFVLFLRIDLNVHRQWRDLRDFAVGLGIAEICLQLQRSAPVFQRVDVGGLLYGTTINGGPAGQGTVYAVPL